MSIQDSRTLPAWSQERRTAVDLVLLHFKNLCLDAPLVALVWQEFFARAWEAPVEPIHRILLAIITWLAYMGDRILDGPHQGQEPIGSERHSFVWNHRYSLRRLWTVLATVGLALSLWILALSDLLPGLIFLLGLLIYFLAARIWPRLFRGFLPRELLVGVFFSIACSTFVFSTLGRLPALGVLASTAFALLCCLDCWTISCTDRDRDLQQGEWNLVTTYSWAWHTHAKATLAFSGLFLATSFFLPHPPAVILQSIALSCLLLFLLTRALGVTRRLALYADLALVAPPAFFLLM